MPGRQILFYVWTPFPIEGRSSTADMRASITLPQSAKQAGQVDAHADMPVMQRPGSAGNHISYSLIAEKDAVGSATVDLMTEQELNSMFLDRLLAKAFSDN